MCPVGSAAWRGLMRRKSAPSSPRKLSSSVRSAASPTPQDPRERTEYSWAMTPHPRSPRLRGRSRWSGVTTRGQEAVWGPSPRPVSTSATMRCHPRGRSLGRTKEAWLVRTPSTSRAGAGVQSSAWARRLPPPSSRSTLARTTAPSGTWTTRTWEAPPRTTTLGGSTRRQGASSTSFREVAISSCVEARTPMAASTASRVSWEGAA